MRKGAKCQRFGNIGTGAFANEGSFRDIELLPQESYKIVFLVQWVLGAHEGVC